HHPNRPLPHLGGVLFRSRHDSNLSKVGASGKPRAVAGRRSAPAWDRGEDPMEGRMRKLMQAGLSVAPVAAVAGCGALFNSGPAKVTFTSSPEGAEVWVNGMRRGTTPLVLDLQKNQDYTVIFKKPGHADVAVTVSKKVGAGYVVLDVLGGLLPVIIDAATGSWYVLSTNTVHGMLNPATSELSGELTPEQLDQVRRGVPASRFIEIPEELLRDRH